MTSQQTFDLDQLGDAYDVIGELAARREGMRAFMGKRRSDEADVLINVFESPRDDEGNALSHLAADANLLCALQHRHFIPVLEGRWLSHDAFAVVHRRIYAPTLEEMLARRDEEFAYPRIALILQQLNGVLEWARAQKVVHRSFDLDTVHVEPGSDEVLASFAVRPLPLTDMPDAVDDARTIATLARAMLTRSAMDPERENLPLAELRPGLPTAVIEQTEALLATANEQGAALDVNGYIASIAMADAIKRGETACDESMARIVEQERVAREEIEAKQRECERTVLERERAFQQERAVFLKQREAIERALAREKESIQRAVAAEKEALARAAPVVVPMRSRVSRYLGRFKGHVPSWKRGWHAPAAATVVALAIVFAVFASGHDDETTKTATAPTPARRAVQDSAAGTVARPAPRVVPPVPPDMVSGVATRAATEPPPRPARRRPVERDGFLNRPSTQERDAYPPPVQDRPPVQYQPPPVQYQPPTSPPTTPLDTPRRPDLPRLDTSFRPMMRLNLDSILRARRDPTMRRDTIRPDTIPRP